MGPAVENHTAQVYQEFGLRKRKSVNYDNPWPVDILGRIRPVQKHTADERNKQRKEKEKKSENPDLASESAKKAFSTYDVDTSFKLDKTDTNSLRDNAATSLVDGNGAASTHSLLEKPADRAASSNRELNNQQRLKKEERKKGSSILSRDGYNMCIFQCTECRKTFSLEGYLSHAAAARQRSCGRDSCAYSLYHMLREVYHRCKLCGAVYLFTNQHAANHCRRVHNMKYKDYADRHLNTKAVVTNLHGETNLDGRDEASGNPDGRCEASGNPGGRDEASGNPDCRGEAPGNPDGRGEAPGNLYGRDEVPRNPDGRDEAPGNLSGRDEAPGNLYGRDEAPGNPYGRNEAPGNPYGQDEAPGNPDGRDEAPGNPYGRDEAPGNSDGRDESPGNPDGRDEAPRNHHRPRSATSAVVEPIWNAVAHGAQTGSKPAPSRSAAAGGLCEPNSWSEKKSCSEAASCLRDYVKDCPPKQFVHEAKNIHCVVQTVASSQSKPCAKPASVKLPISYPDAIASDPICRDLIPPAPAQSSAASSALSEAVQHRHVASTRQDLGDLNETTENQTDAHHDDLVSPLRKSAEFILEAEGVSFSKNLNILHSSVQESPLISSVHHKQSTSKVSARSGKKLSPQRRDNCVRGEHSPVFKIPAKSCHGAMLSPATNPNKSLDGAEDIPVPGEDCPPSGRESLSPEDSTAWASSSSSSVVPNPAGNVVVDLPSSQSAPHDWYDGTEFGCGQCGYSTCSVWQMEVHVTLVHAVGVREFPDSFAAIRQAFIRCELCGELICQEKTALEFHLGCLHDLTLSDYEQQFITHLLDIG